MHKALSVLINGSHMLRLMKTLNILLEA